MTDLRKALEAAQEYLCEGNDPRANDVLAKIQAALAQPVPGGSEGERSITDRLADVYTWLREPDTIEVASIEWLKGWIDRRPIADVAMIAMLMPAESAVSPQDGRTETRFDDLITELQGWPEDGSRDTAAVTRLMKRASWAIDQLCQPVGTVRAAVIEECSQVAESSEWRNAHNIAARIRALAPKGAA